MLESCPLSEKSKSGDPLLLLVCVIENLPSGKSTFTDHILQPSECSIMVHVALYTLLAVSPSLQIRSLNATQRTFMKPVEELKRYGG
jgi:hypothetical protein